MKTLKKIGEIFKKELPYLKEKYYVKKIGIFGPYVRGENKKNSNLDPLVEFSPPIGFEFLELKNDLNNKFNLRIDLVTLKSIKTIYIYDKEK